MAKLTKTVLKGIVKECLVEILSEGLLGNQQVLTAAKTQPQKKKRPVKKTRPGNNKFQKKVQESTRALTEDPVMAAIFEDTARTTLQEQIQNESSPMVPRHDMSYDDDGTSEQPVDSLFEGSSNWAALAFAEKKNI